MKRKMERHLEELKHYPNETFFSISFFFRNTVFIVIRNENEKRIKYPLISHGGNNKRIIQRKIKISEITLMKMKINTLESIKILEQIKLNLLIS